MNWKHDLTPCLICKLSSQDYHRKQSWKIVKAKFEILSSEYSADLHVSRLPLEVVRLRDFFAAASKAGRDMTIMTKSSAIEWLTWILPNGCFWHSPFLLQIEAYQNWSSTKVIWDQVCHKITNGICPAFHMNMKQCEIDFDRVFSNFAFAKARKVKIW